MTIDFVALSPSRQRSHGWTNRHLHFFAATDAYVPLLLPELPAAVAIYPLAFVKRPDAKAQLVVVQSLQAGKNLFVDEQGRWLACYVPSHYRGYRCCSSLPGCVKSPRLN